MPFVKIPALPLTGSASLDKLCLTFSLSFFVCEMGAVPPSWAAVRVKMCKELGVSHFINVSSSPRGRCYCTQDSPRMNRDVNGMHSLSLQEVSELSDSISSGLDLLLFPPQNQHSSRPLMAFPWPSPSGGFWSLSHPLGNYEHYWARKSLSMDSMTSLSQFSLSFSSHSLSLPVDFPPWPLNNDI